MSLASFFPSPFHLLTTENVTFSYTNSLYDHVFQATNLSLFAKNMNTNTIICLVKGLLVNDFKDFKEDLEYSAKITSGTQKKIF